MEIIIKYFIVPMSIGAAFCILMAQITRGMFMPFGMVLLGIIQSYSQIRILSRYTSRTTMTWVVITVGSATLALGLFQFILIPFAAINVVIAEIFTIPDTTTLALARSTMVGAAGGVFVGSIVSGIQWIFAYNRLVVPPQIKFTQWLVLAIIGWFITITIPTASLYLIWVGVHFNRIEL